jgi:hypothetical protein
MRSPERRPDLGAIGFGGLVRSAPGSGARIVVGSVAPFAWPLVKEHRDQLVGLGIDKTLGRGPPFATRAVIHQGVGSASARPAHRQPKSPTPPPPGRKSPNEAV